MNKIVDAEVKSAYSDCWMKDRKAASKLRNLDFRASEPVSKKEAIRIINKYVPEYNEFTSELLDFLPDDSEIGIAREGSVCIYVTSEELSDSPALQKNLCKALEADEFDYDEDNDEWRIWWD
jgi:hypothetical protein